MEQSIYVNEITLRFTPGLDRGSTIYRVFVGDVYLGKVWRDYNDDWYKRGWRIEEPTGRIPDVLFASRTFALNALKSRAEQQTATQPHH